MWCVIRKTVATGALAAATMASVAEGSATKSLRPIVDGDATGLVARAHGSHSACVYGEYREAGKGREGWHQHLRGEAYRCTPGSTEKAIGIPPGLPPGGSGKSSDGDRGTTGDRGRSLDGDRSDRGRSSDGDRGKTSGGSGSTESKPGRTSATPFRARRIPKPSSSKPQSRSRDRR
jgi:hypothetical protein